MRPRATGMLTVRACWNGGVDHSQDYPQAGSLASALTADKPGRPRLVAYAPLPGSTYNCLQGALS